MYVVLNKNNEMIAYSKDTISCNSGIVIEIPDEEFDESMLKVQINDKPTEKSEIEILKEQVALLQQALDDLILNGGVI